MFFDHLVLGATGEFLNIGDILATLVIFIGLMLLLKKFAWGPLMGVMQQREDLIKSEIETAENSRLESQKMLEEQRGLLKDARTQAQEIVENAKKQGEVSREEIITTARAESSRMKEAAVQEIANERDKAISAVREEVVALSLLAATKVLEKEISEEDNRQLINETIAKAGEVQ
ncbi:ATP synthase B chain [Planococcus donghaensis MPA1U2]|uniref:ATP synthase subunit b n=2 Tax=Planococcus donghaensis TaxID=414778 RepID=E7RL56_9BACL|nr:F0F1 ATP synthase subunit B [Planococcus donghaensis]ANU22420.1 ATP synthase F0 subunit B [Planococcus donghaensis]EGA88248.1 ATP synthase B chain [Planococcus donghaensis MPA1U2]